MSDTPARPTAEQLAHYARGFEESRAMRSFGARLAFPDGERVEVTLPVRPEHQGGLGTAAVNGGVLAAMFDLAIGCSPALVDPLRRCATVQLSMSFMRPVLGDVLRVVARVDSAGGSTVFASAEALDAGGRVCARCQGVVKLGRVPWKNPGTPGVD